MIINDVLIRKLKIPVFKTRLWIVISKSISKSIDTVEDIIDHKIIEESGKRSTKAYMYAYEHVDGKYTLILFLKDTAKPGTVAHECSHAVKVCLHWHGVKPSYTNDENEAYMLEWLVDQVHFTLKRYNK